MRVFKDQQVHDHPCNCEENDRKHCFQCKDDCHHSTTNKAMTVGMGFA